MILEIIELALYFGRTLVTILHCTKIQAIRPKDRTACFAGHEV